ncbi:MAG: PqqD family protein [Deltaproteobacteria bacterium]
MMELTLDAICAPSEDVVARMIEDELIIVPLVAGIGDMEDELYTMNDTGKAIWSRLDGEKSLRDLVAELATEFDASPGKIEKDVLGLMTELASRKMVVVQ